jgi:hypothetical protein
VEGRIAVVVGEVEAAHGGCGEGIGMDCVGVGLVIECDVQYPTSDYEASVSGWASRRVVAFTRRRCEMERQLRSCRAWSFDQRLAMIPVGSSSSELSLEQTKRVGSKSFSNRPGRLFVALSTA